MSNGSLPPDPGPPPNKPPNPYTITDPTVSTLSSAEHGMSIDPETRLRSFSITVPAGLARINEKPAPAHELICDTLDLIKTHYPHVCIGLHIMNGEIMCNNFGVYDISATALEKISYAVTHPFAFGRKNYKFLFISKFKSV